MNDWETISHKSTLQTIERLSRMDPYICWTATQRKQHKSFNLRNDKNISINLQTITDNILKTMDNILRNTLRISTNLYIYRL
ncbi:hypothetical protein KUTeg_013962 [Tegillarca granosa]|uniref:Uncharacterized protein n=1 Tax=Tegillarca granosa TaxID=220873 RepID=A0ABQ9F0M7_TEGGR|nr:hypothetical protein KUTeg_013962 [Tegillarca granosa]